MSTSNQTNQPQGPSLKTRLAITVSCVGSVCAFVWFLSMPFRESIASNAPKPPSNDPSWKVSLVNVEQDITQQLERKRIDAEEIRDQAIALDYELKDAVAEKRRRQQAKPGISYARQHHQTKRAKIAREIKQLGKPEAQSPQWYQQQYLLEQLNSNGDAPL